MKKRTIIVLILFVFLTTITSQLNLSFSKFDLKKIEIENNFLLDKEEIKNSLAPVYGKNLIFLNTSQIKNILIGNTYIESFNIKKRYPNTLKIKIFEKKPIVILMNKRNKFYLSEKLDLIEFKKFQNYSNLPYVYGNKDQFKDLYLNLKKINFPIKLIKKYTLYELNRWDIETIDKKIIKLPKINYTDSLENYLNLKGKNNFRKYSVFDYRIKNQLILK
jgi:cell division septal protein FtsQ